MSEQRTKTTRGGCAVGAVPSLVTLPVAQLTPNDYNPNRMTADEFAELVAEVKHLVRLPKPVVVRPQGDDYLIVDGEHNWRAAREAGLTEVPCEVLEADDFEAMRQTYKRNQHGSHDPVLLGRMLRRMMEERQLSGRGLAEEIGVSEGTVRNGLAYAEAAGLRNSYAAAGGKSGRRLVLSGSGELREATPDEEVAWLSVREVRAYTSLPAGIRDAWFNAGHSPERLDSALRVRMRLNPEKGEEQTCLCEVETLLALAEVGLAETITSQGFVDSCHRAIRIYFWREHYRQAFADPAELDTHILPVARLGLDADLLDAMPVEVGEAGLVFLLPVPEWQDLLETCKERASDRGSFWALFEAGVSVALRRHGHSREDLTDPRTMEVLHRLAAAPDFIREAECLTLDERLWLHELQVPELDDEALVQVKVEAVETACVRRNWLREYGAQGAGAVGPVGIDAAVQERVTDYRRTREQERRDAVLSDPERLVDEFVAREKGRHLLFSSETVGGRPADEVLRERLSALPEAERVLLLGALLFSEVRNYDFPTHLWVRAIEGESQREEGQPVAPTAAIERTMDGDGCDVRQRPVSRRKAKRHSRPAHGARARTPEPDST